MKTVRICRDYYEKREYIFKKSEVEIKPGLTVLVGCNGIGKTTFIKNLKEELEKEHVEIVSYDNIQDGGHNAMDKAMFHGNFEFVGRAFCSSEGERIRQNIEEIATQCGKAVRNIRSMDKKKELWVILDAVDSGFSVDNIVDLKNDLFNVMIENVREYGIELYIVVSANEYELARGENCLDVVDMKYLTFKDYEDYRQFILKSRKKKEKRGF